MIRCVRLHPAGKFRHDQYQKVVKEKTRLKAMLQNAVQRSPLPPAQQAGDGKSKLKSSGFEAKRSYDYASTPHPLELKKRKTADHTAAATASATALPAPVDAAQFTPKTESAGFRANAYSDVTVRPVTTARPSFTRSSYNPNQYGAYNITPSTAAPVQAPSSEAVCRRGYDETGKLTNFFLPKSDAKRSSSSSSGQRKAAPSMQHLLGMPQSSGSGTNASANQRPTSSDRRDYALTSWLRNES